MVEQNKLSRYIPIDDFFKANDKAVERKHGPADKSGILEKLLSEGGLRTCRATGCDVEVEGRYQYCENCRDEQKRLRQRDWHRKKRKREMLAMLEGEE